MTDDITDPNDPWIIQNNLDDFLFYCCPECDIIKLKSKEKFIIHALNEHPKSKIHFENFLVKIEHTSDQEDDNENNTR